MACGMEIQNSIYMVPHWCIYILHYEESNPNRCVVELQTELDSLVEGLLWLLGRVDV